jgi:hypothetical protein
VKDSANADKNAPAGTPHNEQSAENFSGVRHQATMAQM